MKVRMVSFVDRDLEEGTWHGDCARLYDEVYKYDDPHTHVIMTIEDYEDLMNDNGGSE